MGMMRRGSEAIKSSRRQREERLVGLVRRTLRGDSADSCFLTARLTSSEVETRLERDLKCSLFSAPRLALASQLKETSCCCEAVKRIDNHRLWSALRALLPSYCPPPRPLTCCPTALPPVGPLRDLGRRHHRT